MTAKSIGGLRLKLSQLGSDLHEAKTDLELYARLQDAPNRLKAVQAEYNEAMSALRKAEIAAEKEQREGRYRGLSDLEIVEVPDKDGGGLLRSIWRISYAVSAYDGYSTKPAAVTRNGFEELEPHVLTLGTPMSVRSTRTCNRTLSSLVRSPRCFAWSKPLTIRL
jgi:hypothetical protein